MKALTQIQAPGGLLPCTASYGHRPQGRPSRHPERHQAPRTGPLASTASYGIRPDHRADSQVTQIRTPGQGPSPAPPLTASDPTTGPTVTSAQTAPGARTGFPEQVDPPAPPLMASDPITGPTLKSPRSGPPGQGPSPAPSLTASDPTAGLTLTSPLRNGSPRTRRSTCHQDRHPPKRKLKARPWVYPSIHRTHRTPNHPNCALIGAPIADPFYPTMWSKGPPLCTGSKLQSSGPNF